MINCSLKQNHFSEIQAGIEPRTSQRLKGHPFPSSSSQEYKMYCPFAFPFLPQPYPTPHLRECAFKSVRKDDCLAKV